MLSQTAFLFVLALAGTHAETIEVDADGDTTSLLQTPAEMKPSKEIHMKTESKEDPDFHGPAGSMKDSPYLIGESTTTTPDPGAAPAPAEEEVAAPASAPADPAAIDMKAALAEFIAMTLFVIIGCGSAMSLAKESAWLLQVSLAFGIAITVLAYTIGHISGGQINCAVTLGLCIQGHLSWAQGALNFGGQMLGSVLGAIILHSIFGEDRDKTGGLGSNSVSVPEGKELADVIKGALIGEFVMTFLLVFVVLECAVNPATAANAVNAPLAIGFAVFLAHCMLIPIDGCSINPTRSFGPMLVRKMCYKDKGSLSDHWVFWVGPLLGAAAAAGVYMAMTP